MGTWIRASAKRARDVARPPVLQKEPGVVLSGSVPPVREKKASLCNILLETPLLNYWTAFWMYRRKASLDHLPIIMIV